MFTARAGGKVNTTHEVLTERRGSIFSMSSAEYCLHCNGLFPPDFSPSIMSRYTATLLDATVQRLNEARRISQEFERKLRDPEAYFFCVQILSFIKDSSLVNSSEVRIVAQKTDR